MIKKKNMNISIYSIDTAFPTHCHLCFVMNMDYIFPPLNI